MKLINEAFPYPILSPDVTNNSDYKDSAFQCNFEEFNNIEKDGTEYLQIKCNFLCSEKNITQCIENNNAQYGLHVKSSSTGFNKLFTMINDDGIFWVPITSLYNKIEITPLIVCIRNIANFSSIDFNDEYLIDDNGQKKLPQYNLKVGDIIAFDDVHTKYLNYERLSMESLLVAQRDEEAPPFIYSIDTNTNYYLVIKMGSKIFEMFNNPEKRDYILSGIIKDCILVALCEYMNNKDDIIEKRWAHLIIEKLEESKIDLNDLKDDIDEINKLAQSISSKYGIERLKDIKK